MEFVISLVELEVKIAKYKDSMKDQVIDLFFQQYKVDKEKFSSFFERFYLHPYQKNNAIVLVALHGSKVVGFQSYYYWPYRYAGKLYNTYESGNSLVHPDYRGQRIFSRLLDHIETNPEYSNVDFLVGFPIDMSYGSLVRKGWKHVSDLDYYVKIFNPMGFLLNPDNRTVEKEFVCDFVDIHFSKNEKIIRKHFDRDYYEWQESYRKTKPHHFFYYQSELGTIGFEFRLRKKAKVVSEISIGDVRRSNDNLTLMSDALDAFHKKLSKLKFIGVCIVAFNSGLENNIASVWKKKAYWKTKKKTYFLTKALRENLEVPIYDKSSWEIYRMDVETW